MRGPGLVSPWVARGAQGRFVPLPADSPEGVYRHLYTYIPWVQPDKDSPEGVYRHVYLHTLGPAG